MRTLVGAIVGVLAAAGVWLAVAGATGVATRRPSTRPTVAWDQLWWRAGLVLGAAVAGWAATGWPAAGVLAGAAAGVAPMLVGTRAAPGPVERAQRGAGGVGRDAARHDRRPRRAARGDRRHRPGGARRRSAPRCRRSPCGPNASR